MRLLLLLLILLLSLPCYYGFTTTTPWWRLSSLRTGLNGYDSYCKRFQSLNNNDYESSSTVSDDGNSRKKKNKVLRRSVLGIAVVSSCIISLVNEMVMTIPHDNNNLNFQSKESQLLSILARVGLDVVGVFTLDPVLVRLAGFLGRVCVILSDYIPDRAITFNEVLFQGAMLWISCILLVKSLAPIYKARSFESSTKSSSFRNRIAWEYLFKPVGMTQWQFESLTYLTAIKWQTYKPGETILSTDVESQELVWVYKGDTQIIFNGKTLPYIVDSKKHKNMSSSCFLADMAFLIDVEEALVKLSSSYNSRDDDGSVMECGIESHGVCQPLTVIAGDSGARVMNISKNDVLNLAKVDMDLLLPFQDLLLKGAQHKLNALLRTTIPTTTIDDGIMRKLDQDV